MRIYNFGVLRHELLNQLGVLDVVPLPFVPIEKIANCRRHLPPPIHKKTTTQPYPGGSHATQKAESSFCLLV